MPAFSITDTKFVLAVLLLFRCILSLHDGIHPLVVDYDEHYYYTTLKDKMAESLSISNCSVGGDIEYSHSPTRGPPDLTVRVMPPPEYIVEKWGLKGTARISKRIFARVSDNLCQAKKFIDVSKGRYKRAKGCYKVYVTDKLGRRIKRFNDYGATLHPEHVRCNNQEVISVCNSGHTGIQVIDASYRELHRLPFMITAQKAVVGKGGMFGLPCGPFGLFASCEAVKWGVPFANKSVEDVAACRDPSEARCPHRKIQRLFVMTQYDDTQIGQFMQEALPKLIYNLDFLYANPDVMIHYGFSKRDVLPDFVLPHWFFRWLGLENRLVNGTVYAEELYMPREGGCQDIGYNAWEVVTMRERFLQMSGIKETKEFVVKPPPGKPTVLILTRTPGKYTQNKADHATRRWAPDKFPILVQSFADNFPDHIVEIFSDKNDTLMQCPLCQAQAFHRADIVVAMHGAGLSNAVSEYYRIQR